MTTPRPGDNAATMTVMDHLRELRSRLIKVSLAVVLGMGAGFWLVSDETTGLMRYIISTFFPQGVQIVKVTEAFTSFIGVALLLGIIMAMPVIIYQLLRFLTPALETSKERRWVFLGLPLVLAFFIAGLTFGWFITAPTAIAFLTDFGRGTTGGLIENKPTLDDGLSLLTRLLLISGIIFEMPILMFTLAKLKILNPRRIVKYRRYIILAVVIIAAIITPTGDPANLALTAVPMYVLFEFGLLLGRLA